MINEQQGGTSHHFIMDTSNDTQRKKFTRTKQVPINKAKPSWQIERDISMDTFSSKATKLSSRQDVLSNRTSPSSSSSRTKKKYVPYRKLNLSEPFQTYRIPLMPTEKEATKVAISYEDLCSFCEGPYVGDYIRCRICTKTYHSKCLFKYGYIRNESFNLPRLAKPDWSCPECNDFTHLLNQDELDYLIHAFEQIDRDKDGYIILEEFLSFQSNKNLSEGLELFIQYNYDSGKKLFSLIDSTQKGVIAWSDFVMFYSWILIAVKDKTELTTKLTDKELVMARKLFLKDPKKALDNNFDMVITREYFTRIYKNFIQSLKKKYSAEFIDVILDDGSENDDQLKKLSVMTWSEFLCDLSLLILLNRLNDDFINSQLRRASIPPHLSKFSIVSHSKFLYPTQFRTPSSSKLTISRSTTPMGITTTNIFCDESFRKHAKLLDKLNQTYKEEELKKKNMGSEMNFSIVESLDEEEDLNLPKLKINARDDRKSITDPWTAVKEIEQLRTQLIFIETIRLNMIKA